MDQVLTIAYPPELPISQRHDELLAAIEAHQVVVVAGETGSGKSTQLPKLCLELGRGAGGRGRGEEDAGVGFAVRGRVGVPAGRPEPVPGGPPARRRRPGGRRACDRRVPSAER